MNVHLSSCPVILSNCVVLHVKVWYFMLLSCIDTVETTLSDWCDIGMILHGPELHCTDNIYRSDPEWLACHWCCAEWNLRVGSIIVHSSVNRFWRSWAKPLASRLSLSIQKLYFYFLATRGFPNKYKVCSCPNPVPIQTEPDKKITPPFFAL